MAETLLRRWPLLRQILGGGDGTGPEAMSPATRALRDRTQAEGTKTFRSVCPYCAVGCGQLVHVQGGKLAAIEGDPASPISQGALCPKGSASFELLTHPRRETRVKYRPPHGTAWQELDLETAMDMLAERVYESRRRTFVREQDGRPIGHTTAVTHLGGATLDDEENYLIKKLFTGGLGMVALSNQALI
jgi:formate dehydrogenase major subunit